jgi:coatomer subunit beta
MSQQDPISYAVVSDDLRQIEQGSTQELRQGLEKGNDEVKLETLRRIVVATLNGNPQVRLIPRSG